MRNLERMIHFAEWLPGAEKCATLSRILSWSHFFELLTVPERQKREFYAAFAVHERWSVRTLRAKIAGKQYERTIAARGSVEGIEADLATFFMKQKLTDADVAAVVASMQKSGYVRVVDGKVAYSLEV